LLNLLAKLKSSKAFSDLNGMLKLRSGIFANSPTMGTVPLGFELGTETIDCRYIPRDDRAKQTIAGLIAAAKQADRVFIASDPDREGEVIGWHTALS
jgi:DNA topoisomerase I